MDIFRIYIEKLLKNVQDGIIRRIGSRENQKTKVCTVLRDTLYNKVALAKEDTFIVQTRLSLKVVGWLGKILASLDKILKKNKNHLFWFELSCES